MESGEGASWDNYHLTDNDCRGDVAIKTVTTVFFADFLN